MISYSLNQRKNFYLKLFSYPLDQAEFMLIAQDEHPKYHVD